MKRFLKKLTCIFISAAMLISMTAVTASASVSYDDEIVVYYNSSNGYDYESIYVGNLSSSDTIKKSSIKTSNKKVASLYSLSKNISKNTYQYFSSGSTDSSNTYYNYNIGLHIQGTGKATVSFKIGSKTYKTKITAYKYTNPLKSLIIKGVNGSKNLASAFKSTRYVSGTKFSGTQKNATAAIVAKSGWKITSVYCYDGEDINRSMYSNKGLSKVTVHLGTLTAKSSNQYVSVTLKNTKTGGSVTCQYSF